MESCINFKQETLDIIATIPKELLKGRISVCVGNKWCYLDDCIENFDFDYDNGYGGAEIDGDIVLCDTGKRWVIKRNEYDGSEWWELCTLVRTSFYSAITREDVYKEMEWD
jgi:hypothetical protein